MAVDGGIRLSCAVQGDPAAPAVVMLPGPTDSWRSYEPVLERLPSSVRAIAVSQRGHGDSDRPERGYRVEDFAADVVPLLDALEIGRAVLVGHSGSCPVARRVALESPERVAGLVLEASPTTLRDDAGLEAFLASVVSDLEDPIDPELVRTFVADTSTDAMDPDFVDVLVAEVLQVPARVWKEMFAALQEYDDTDRLESIAAPTRLVWGDADQLVGRDMQDRLVGSIPDATLLVHPGVGHTPRWEDPARFATDLAAFVRRTNQAAATAGRGPRGRGQLPHGGGPVRRSGIVR